MSGRGRGRSGGRSFYRKGSKGPRSFKQTGKDPVKNDLSDYVYHIGTAKQASDFVVVTKYLINYIKKTYSCGEDISDALELRIEVDFESKRPSMRRSTVKDKEEKKMENAEFSILYEAEVASYMKRRDTYTNNLINAYGFLFEHCSKAMQSKIQSRVDFEKIKNNPIELLNAIEQHSVSYQENKYDMVIITEALLNLVNIKQREDESLVDYTTRFKSARDVFKSQYGGRLELPKAVEARAEEQEEELDKEELKQLQKDTYDMWIAYVFLRNAD